jgi:hypothetical protein
LTGSWITPQRTAALFRQLARVVEVLVDQRTQLSHVKGRAHATGAATVVPSRTGGSLVIAELATAVDGRRGTGASTADHRRCRGRHLPGTVAHVEVERKGITVGETAYLDVTYSLGAGGENPFPTCTIVSIEVNAVEGLFTPVVTGIPAGGYEVTSEETFTIEVEVPISADATGTGVAGLRAEVHLPYASGSNDVGFGPGEGGICALPDGDNSVSSAWADSPHRTAHKWHPSFRPDETKFYGRKFAEWGAAPGFWGCFLNCGGLDPGPMEWSPKVVTYSGSKTDKVGFKETAVPIYRPLCAAKVPPVPECYSVGFQGLDMRCGGIVHWWETFSAVNLVEGGITTDEVVSRRTGEEKRKLWP